MSLTFSNTFAQSPGDASSDLELWLKIHICFATNQWDDQSENNYHAVIKLIKE